MAGRVKAFWKRWWGKVIVILAALLILGVAASLVAAKYTESNTFCGHSCHEMNVYATTWAASTHMHVNCVTCHIAPGPVSFLKAKLSGLREVWVHVTGQVKAPIAVTRKIPNSACTRSGCHPSGSLNDHITLAAGLTTGTGVPAPSAAAGAPGTFSHKGHTKVPHCIDCHSQLVHFPIPGQAYVPTNSMTACFACHTDGPKNCTYCHQGPHPQRGPCQDCHNLWGWQGGKNFQHPQPLVGAHATLICEQCHTQGVAVKPDGCVSCHGDQHNGLKNCVDCHVLAAWVPSTFKHPQEGPHVPRGDEPLPCNACHRTGFGQPASCPCHGGNPPTGGG